MSLLISRDKTVLEATEGEAKVNDDLPDFLKTPRVVVQDEVQKMQDRKTDDDLLVYPYEADIYNDDINDFIWPSGKGKVPAFWSGYRSCLTYDFGGDKWFRLKGVSLNPAKPEITQFEDGVFWIQGGQKLENSWYEKNMSERFSRVLENEGIEPAMKYKGMWVYPNKVKGSKAAASIFEVKGDTRLDELMFILENNFLRRHYFEIKGEGKNARLEIGNPTKNGIAVANNFIGLYHQIGYTLGRMKRLMDKSEQTWSCQSERSNAHIGNVVVYGNPDRGLKLGIVDFDASCDSHELSKSELEDIRKKEYETIINSGFSLPISPRQTGGFLSDGRPLTAIGEFRQAFAQGFQEGYACNHSNVTNGLFMHSEIRAHHSWRSILGGIFYALRSGEMFSEPLRRAVPAGFKREIPVIEKRIEDLDSIIRRHYDFEQDIIKYKEKDSYNLRGIIYGERNKKDYFGSLDYGIKRNRKKSSYGIDFGLYNEEEKEENMYSLIN